MSRRYSQDRVVAVGRRKNCGGNSAEGFAFSSVPSGHPVSTALGLSKVKFIPTANSYLRSLNEGETNLMPAQIQCITAMESYKGFSLEELRWDDYCSTSYVVSPSETTKQNFTRKQFEAYVTVIDLSPSSESSCVDDISWPVKSSEPKEIQMPVNTESSGSSVDSGQKRNSASPAPDGAVETSVLSDTCDTVQNSDDETTSVSGKFLTKESFQTFEDHRASVDKLGDNTDDATKQMAEFLQNSDSAVSVPDDKPLASANNLYPVSSASEILGSSGHLRSAFDVVKCSSFNSTPSEPSIEDRCRKDSIIAESLSAHKDIQITSQNLTAEFVSRSCSRTQLNIGDDKHSKQIQMPEESSSDALVDEISRLSDLQRSLCTTIGRTYNKELLCCSVINELRRSRDVQQYQKLPMSLLCAEAKHREMMTRQLMDLFDGISIYSQLHRCVQLALIEEFEFISHLKRIMIEKSMENGKNKMKEAEAGSCSRYSDCRAAASATGLFTSGINHSHRVQVASEDNAQDDVYRHVSDLHAQQLLNRDTDVLMFSDPGKLFRFEVQPGSRFVESWKQRGSGIVSLYQDKAAEMVKIVVRHWSSKQNYSLILIRSSMRTKTTVSRNGLQLKFMGLEVSRCKEKMRYFMIQFDSRKLTQTFNRLLHSLPFLNITDHSIESCSTCCLDVVFKSQRIHEEFPSMTADDEHDQTTADVTMPLAEDDFHDGDKFKRCSYGKVNSDEDLGTDDGCATDIARGLQMRENSFLFGKRNDLAENSETSGTEKEAVDLARACEMGNQEPDDFKHKVTMTNCIQNCTEMSKAAGEKTHLDADEIKAVDDNVIEGDCSRLLGCEDATLILSGNSGDSRGIGIKDKSGTVKYLEENENTEKHLDRSIENISVGLSDPEISSTTILFSDAVKHSSVGLSFCADGKGDADVDEDKSKTDISQDGFELNYENENRFSLDQNGRYNSVSEKNLELLSTFPSNTDCKSKLLLDPNFQLIKADDCELTGLKDEILMENHGKITDQGNCTTVFENDVISEEGYRLNLLEVIRPTSPCSNFNNSNIGSFETSEQRHITCDDLECVDGEFHDKNSYLNGDSAQQVTGDVVSVSVICDRSDEKDGFESEHVAGCTTEFSSDVLITKDKEDKNLNDTTKLGFEGSSIAQNQKQDSDVVSSDNAVSDFLSCREVFCEATMHLTRILKTLDKDAISHSSESQL